MIARSGYTSLDVLSDVGGLESMVISIIAFTLSILNHNHFDSFMVTLLYRPSDNSG